MKMKPAAWNFSPGAVAGRWLWSDRFQLALPVFNPSKDVLDVANNEWGVRAGTNASSIDGGWGVWGPAVVMPSSEGRIEFAGRGDVGDTDITFAGVGQGTLATATAIVGTSSLNSGMRLDTTTGKVLTFTKGGVAAVNGPTLTSNVPYFMAASYRVADGAINILAMDLRSNSIETVTSTDTQTPDAGNGTWFFGGFDFFGITFEGPLGMGAIIREYLSLDLLVQWAEDPWAPFSPAAVAPFALVVCDAGTNKRRGSYPPFAPMILAPCPDGTID